MVRLTGWVAAAAAALVASGVPAPAWASGERARIQLRDGPLITGDIVGVERGAYVIDSPGLGRLRVPASAVAGIREAAPAPRRRANAHDRGDPTRTELPAVLDIGALEEPAPDPGDWLRRARSVDTDPAPFPASVDVDAGSLP